MYPMINFLMIVFITGACDYEESDLSSVINVPIHIGVTTFNFTIMILDDDIYEITEKFNIEISLSPHHQIKYNTDQRMASVFIIDDEERE